MSKIDVPEPRAFAGHLDTGMTLHEYYAGQALIALIGLCKVDQLNAGMRTAVVKTAWEFADDMMQERG